MKYILAVEDDPINQLIIEDYLSQDYKVDLVDDGQKCLDSVKEKEPDIILLDIAIPSVDGYEVCKILKADEQYKNIPIVMVTAYASKIEKQRALDIGADDYLTKPFKYDSLLEIVEKYL